MKIYPVGGFVRDKIMGVQPNDKDYVVVGSTVEEMLSQGFELVGKSFPVFLKDGEEYALARTERKSGHGYNGFEVDFNACVTIEEDLYRRDLTMNAIALDECTGVYIDPYNGVEHIRQKILHPVSSHFKDDPLRVLRAARFLARYSDFSYSNMLLEYGIESFKELKYLPPERIIAELEKCAGSKVRGVKNALDFLYNASDMTYFLDIKRTLEKLSPDYVLSFYDIISAIAASINGSRKYFNRIDIMKIYDLYTGFEAYSNVTNITDKANVISTRMLDYPNIIPSFLLFNNSSLCLEFIIDTLLCSYATGDMLGDVKGMSGVDIKHKMNTIKGNLLRGL